MYLFSRSVRLGPGSVQDQLAWSFSITEKVNQISELEVGLWTTVFSPGLGTLVWTAMCEELAELEASDAKMMADSTYLALLDEGARYSAGEAANDALVQVIYAGAAPSELPQYANVVEAVLAPGAMGRGIELGVTIAQQAEKITGGSTSFGAAATGAYGAVMWASTFDSVEQLQKAGEAIGGNADFVATIDSDASTAYLAGSTTQTMYRRLL